MRVTEKGQVTISKELRNALGIGAGTEVALKRPDDAIVVRKVEGAVEPSARDGEPPPRSGRRPAEYRGDHGAHAAALIHGFRDSRRQQRA
ncbi:MAG: AbrB/MazE/SpoVT family DNA-binding domain-containing protein, partial [Actinomycetota bacterium]|nr:AbrB/MazE/SpoVT family DNA-binding domain-containing protein [Actinomycetota bacterium]